MLSKEKKKKKSAGEELVRLSSMEEKWKGEVQFLGSKRNKLDCFKSYALKIYSE
jgi:hypothetical protein